MSSDEYLSDSTICVGNKSLPNTRIAHYYSVQVPSSTLESSYQLVGLKNLGVTCWFNVVIQLLYHIPKFRQDVLEFMIKEEQVSDSLSSHTVLSVLQDLFISISFSEKKQINPTKAYESIGKLLEGGIGQQDASEYLDILLEQIRVVMPEVVEGLFYGSYSLKPFHNNERFLQYSIQVDSNTTLLMSLKSSLTISHSKSKTQNETENQMQCLTHLPPIFMINVSRLVRKSDCNELVKNNDILSFPALFFMDGFMLENAEQFSNIDAALKPHETMKSNYQSKLNSFEQLLKSIYRIKEIYKVYPTLVDTTIINFGLLSSLTQQWEEEIAANIHLLKKDIYLIDEKMDRIKSRQMSNLRPYQLHAIIVHEGQSDVGHYYIYVWNSRDQTWSTINDHVSRQVTWDSIAKTAFGGRESNSSAHCLIYIDTLKAHSLLDMNEKNASDCVNVLQYLKDPTDIRTRHASYGKNQTFKALFGVICDEQQNPSSLLYQALDNERLRLFGILDEWIDKPIDNEVRLRHFAVYLLANQVSFEPFVYWTLLQHFSIYAIQAQERTNDVCIAARHSLALLENSLSLSNKKIFIEWNAFYHQFRLIVRHVMAAITHLLTQNFSAAVSLAVKALYLHYDLMKNSFRGPAMSLEPSIFHSLIKTSLTSLSKDLLSHDLITVKDIACTVLFDGINNWYHYTDTANLEATISTSRLITAEWSQRMEISTTPMAEVQRKVQNIEIILDSLDEKGNTTPFDFKGHIPENIEDGDKLATKWNHMLKNAMEHNIFCENLT